MSSSANPSDPPTGSCATTTIVFSLANTGEKIAPTRGGAGIATGALALNTYAVAQMFAGPRAAGTWIGVQNAIGNLSGILGPIATGIIVDSAGYQAAFGELGDVQESLVGAVFLAAAVSGFKSSLWLIVAALAAHGINSFALDATSLTVAGLTALAQSELAQSELAQPDRAQSASTE